MKISITIPTETKIELRNISEGFDAYEQELVMLNFRLGDLLNQSVKETGALASDLAKAFAANSEFHFKLCEVNARIARRIPKEHRPKKTSWSAIKYMAADTNPKRFKELGFTISEDDFSTAVVKAFKQIEAENHSWSDLKKESEGISLGEKLIINHL